jgi:hypothetical protein
MGSRRNQSSVEVEHKKQKPSRTAMNQTRPAAEELRKGEFLETISKGLHRLDL